MLVGQPGKGLERPMGVLSQPGVSQGIVEKSSNSTLPPIPSNDRKSDPGVTKRHQNVTQNPSSEHQITESIEIMESIRNHYIYHGFSTANHWILE